MSISRPGKSLLVSACLVLNASVCLPTALTTAQASSAQAFEAAQIQQLDRYFKDLNQYNQFRGGVALSQQGKLIYQNYPGFADSNKQIPLTEKSHFRIGSISKVFTAALVFKAIEAGILRLDTPLKADFPGIRSDKITVETLLHHRSGLPNFTNDPEYVTYMTQQQSPAQMLKRIFTPPLDFEPDSKGEYSNSNYYLLSLLLEKRYQKPFATILQEQIIGPLQLKETHYGGPVQLADGDTYSFEWLEKRWQQQSSTDLSIPLGAGGIVSTPQDLNHFLRDLIQGRLIGPDSVKQMQVLKNGLGRGLFAIPFGPEQGWGHNGQIDSFNSSSVYFPETDLALTVLSNGHQVPLNDIMLAVLSIYHQQPFQIPDFSIQPIQLEASQLNALVGKYTSQDLPLAIEITVSEGVLYAQATGQQAIPLTPYPKHAFLYAAAGVRIVFTPITDYGQLEFELFQGGQHFRFNRQPQTSK